MSYERISLSLISACSALLGAAIGAWAVTWTERRKYKQIYTGKTLSLLEEGLENYARVINYCIGAEKIEINELDEYYFKIVNFHDNHPLLLTQVEVIDRKLWVLLLDLLSFLLKKRIPKLKKEEIRKAVDQLDTKLKKCHQRLYEVLTE